MVVATEPLVSEMVSPTSPPAEADLAAWLPPPVVDGVASMVDRTTHRPVSKHRYASFATTRCDPSDTKARTSENLDGIGMHASTYTSPCSPVLGAARAAPVHRCMGVASICFAVSGAASVGLKQRHPAALVAASVTSSTCVNSVDSAAHATLQRVR